MSGTEYVLLPDRREVDGNFDEAMEIASGGLSEASPDEVLPRLVAIDWAHPALLAYRERDQDRWSTVLLGLTKPEFGAVDG